MIWKHCCNSLDGDVGQNKPMARMNVLDFSRSRAVLNTSLGSKAAASRVVKHIG